MGLLIAAGALVFGYAAAWVASDDVKYLTRAGIEETRILAARVPISALATDTAAPFHLRTAAGLVQDAREHARRLGLEVGETYTTFSDVGRDTLLLVLTASPKHCLCPATWWFPVVGRAPYKGFFDFDKGRKEAERYRIRDYDVHLRPSPAFSTLGWFNDPLLSTAVSPDQVELAALVFHEIGHNTVWRRGATDFNESFAQWLGYRAAEQFFLVRGDSSMALRALQRWHDERILGRYYDRLLERLDSLYSSNPTPTELIVGRDDVMRWARDTLASPFGEALRTIDPQRLGAQPINNAALIGVRLYRTGLDRFDEWYRLNQHDLAASVFALREALEEMKEVDPWSVLSILNGDDPALTVQ